MATGSAGGSRIITATLQELYHHIDQGLNGKLGKPLPFFSLRESECASFQPRNACINRDGTTSFPVKHTLSFQLLNMGLQVSATAQLLI